MAKKDWMVSESQLDDDQLRVLFATNDKSCVVSGCAGSGKSVLALIKAQRIQKEKGNNYKIIVYTKALCNYMNAGRESLGLVNEFSYHEEWKWKKYLKHYANGASYMVYERDENGDKVPNMPSADYIIVDEIQDFTQEEIEEFIHAANKNFFFFGDTAQSIYQGLKDTIPVGSISRLLPFGQEPKDFPLYRNYRLPIPVAKVAQEVGIDLDPFDENVYRSPEKAMPRFISYPSLEDQLKAIKRIIETQSLTDVAILLPHNPEAKQVSGILNQIGLNHEAKYEDHENWKNRKENLNFSTTNPKVMTYHSAKGLQFEAVFMPYVMPLDDDYDRRISEQKAIYVAMTRTYRYLYVMYSGSLPYPFGSFPKICTLPPRVKLLKSISDMKKYYIPTTSLNFNNILSSESVSPHSFFERRGFGYPRWFNIPENPLENSIVLYENFGCFDLPVTDVESHPMIIEVCLPDDEIETLLQLDNHIFLCDHTIYLDPKSSRFLFFDEEYLRITLSLSDASLETKMVKLYERRIQTVGKPEYCYPPISTGERQELNLSAIEFDKSLNKMKGLLYGFYIGSLLSSSREMVVQLKTYLSIKNVFAAILASSDHKATPAQLEQLSALFAIVQPPVPFLEKLKSILNDESVYQAVAKLVRGEYGYIRGEYDVHRIVNNLLAEPVDPEAENPELKKILNAIDVLEKNIRISAPKADVDSCPILVSEGKSSRLNIDDVPPEERELYIYWVNEVLSSEVYNGKISTFKNELSDEIAKASKVFFGQNWDSSPKRVLLNEIRSFVRGQSFEHVWANDIYSSIAAVMAKGDDWQGLLQFMRQKEMFDYRIAFSFYGVLNGFANLSRDFTDILFDGDKKYTWTVYQDFYGQLLSRNIPDSALAPTSPVTSSEEIDDLPPDEDMPDFTAGNASSPDSSKEQADTEDDASIPLEVFLADIYTLCPGAKKDENVYRRLYAEHDGINLDFAYAVYNDTKLNQGKGVQKKIRKYLEEGPQPKKDEKKSRTTSNQEDGSLNLFDGIVPSTGVFLDDFDFLVNNSEFRGLASKAKKKWIDDLRWFIDAHRPGSQEFERYYKDKPLDNETVIRQFVRLKNGVYKRTEEWLKNTYHLF